MKKVLCVIFMLAILPTYAKSENVNLDFATMAALSNRLDDITLNCVLGDEMVDYMVKNVDKIDIDILYDESVRICNKRSINPMPDSVVESVLLFRINTK